MEKKYFDDNGKEVKFFDRKCPECKSKNIVRIDHPISESGSDLGVVWECKKCDAQFFTPYWYGLPQDVLS